MALGLMSILLTFLFSFLAGHFKLEKQMEVKRTSVLARQNVQTRLQDLFISLISSQDQNSLYTQLFPKEEKMSLVFTFDNGVDLDPLFSGMLLGRLYLDADKNLSLVTWPIDQKESHFWRKEVLLPHVSDFSFEFLGEKRDTDPKVKPITAKTGWHPSWPKERSDLPSLIRLRLRQEETPLEFAFRLPTSAPIATYWEGGYRP